MTRETARYGRPSGSILRQNIAGHGHQFGLCHRQFFLGQQACSVAGGVADILFQIPAFLTDLIDIELINRHRIFCEDDATLAIDLDKTAGHKDAVVDGIALIDINGTGFQGRHQRDVIGQNTELTFGARHHNHGDIFGQEPRRHRRGSSGFWDLDRLTEQEEQEYLKKHAS